jgi:hypothetical protein
MSVQLNKSAYEDLIIDDIIEILRHMPEHSLEKKHIIEVLKWSIKQIYPDDIWNRGRRCNNCDGEGYLLFVDQGEPDYDSKCPECDGTGKIPPVSDDLLEQSFNERLMKRMNEKPRFRD